MRLLIISDIHSAVSNAEKLGKRLSDAKIDAILLGGDLSNGGSAETAKEIISALGFAEILAVPGNMDSKEILDLLKEKKICAHKEKKSLGKYTVIGLGGAKPVNTYYRINLSELEAEKYLRQLSEGENPEKTIVLLHSPPYGTKLSKSDSGIDLGMRAIRSFIEKFQPLLVVCGHVHEAAGIERIGRTLCLNPGPLSGGFYAIAEISKDGEINVERCSP